MKTMTALSKIVVVLILLTVTNSAHGRTVEIIPRELTAKVLSVNSCDGQLPKEWSWITVNKQPALVYRCNNNFKAVDVDGTSKPIHQLPLSLGWPKCHSADFKRVVIHSLNESSSDQLKIVDFPQWNVHGRGFDMTRDDFKCSLSANGDFLEATKTDITNGSIAIVDISKKYENYKKLAQTPNGFPVTSRRLTTDGTQIIGVSKEGAMIVDAKTGQMFQQINYIPHFTHKKFAIDPTGKLMVPLFCSESDCNTNVFVYDLRTQQKYFHLKGIKNSNNLVLAFSWDGKYIAAKEPNGNIVLFTLPPNPSK